MKKIKRAVVYPIKDGNKKDGNFELTMSLRSIEKNLKGNIPVFILSESRPPFISDKVNFIKVDGYVDAVSKACDIAEEILWFNDDIFLLKKHDWETFRRWVKHSSNKRQPAIDSMMKHKNGWIRRKGEVLNKLAHMGHTTMDFSSHTPYLYETSKLKIIVYNFDFGYKTAFETAYGNYWSVDIRHCNKLQRYHTGTVPLDVSFYDILNYNDKGATPHIRGFLLGMFPSPSKYEKHNGHDLTTRLASEIFKNA
jgi:hypothetical protein|tara:strand:- start:5418 stop:6173 length:756 start_codon:yes stop_codon:yes gene_type:complete